MRRLTNYRVGWWTIFVCIAVFFLLCCLPAHCQSTTVSATVVDQSSVTWANGSWKIDFVPNPNAGGQVYWNNAPFPNSQWHYAGALDASGVFSSSVPSNNFITPTGSTYTVTVCPNATSPCSVITGLTFQGVTQDISATITANTASPSVKPLPLARAYNDSEVQVNPTLVGYFYLNVTTQRPRYWDGTQWTDFISGVESFTAQNLPPLFTTNIDNTDPTHPILEFNLSQAASNTVYANCTGVTGNPSFCAITAAMLPSAINSNTSGSAGSLSGSLASCTTSGGAQLFGIGISSNGNAICLQVHFSDLAGNISTTQMNSGTNADASHVFIGGNSNAGQWVPFSTVTGMTVITQRATGCATGTGTGSACDTHFSWSPAFADTNYSVSCTGGAPFTSGSSSEANALDETGYENKTTSSVDCVTTSKGSAGPASFGTVDLIAIHQ